MLLGESLLIPTIATYARLQLGHSLDCTALLPNMIYVLVLQGDDMLLPKANI